MKPFHRKRRASWMCDGKVYIFGRKSLFVAKNVLLL